MKTLRAIIGWPLVVFGCAVTALGFAILPNDFGCSKAFVEGMRRGARKVDAEALASMERQMHETH